LNSVTKFLAQYTFEPVTTHEKLATHNLIVKADSRQIPLGHFKLRLKNIDDQHYYDLSLKQKLTNATKSTTQALKPRLHGTQRQHAHQKPTATDLAVLTTLKIKHAPADVPAPKQSRYQMAATVPVMNHQATTMPAAVPVYAFKDSKQLVLNQKALAKLFLAANLGSVA